MSRVAELSSHRVLSAGSCSLRGSPLSLALVPAAIGATGRRQGQKTGRRQLSAVVAAAPSCRHDDDDDDTRQELPSGTARRPQRARPSAAAKRPVTTTLDGPAAPVSASLRLLEITERGDDNTHTHAERAGFMAHKLKWTGEKIGGLEFNPVIWGGAIIHVLVRPTSERV